MRRVDDEVVPIDVRKKELDRLEHGLPGALDRERGPVGAGGLRDQERRAVDPAGSARSLEVHERSRALVTSMGPGRQEEGLAAERLGEALISHDDGDDEPPLRGQQVRKGGQRPARRVEIAGRDPGATASGDR